MLGPGSYRAASFARHLPELGWDPFIVTVKRALYHRDLAYRPPPVRTLRTWAPEPSRLLTPLRRQRQDGDAAEGVKTVSEPALGPLMTRVRRFVRDWVYLPDGQALWIPFAIVAARRALRSTAGSKVLLSSSVPYSSHLAALAVSRLERVPWVAEFRDPWSQIDNRIRPRSKARKRIDAALERLVVESASGIIVTSDLTRQAMARAYPSLDDDRIRVVRNGFEPSEERPAPPPEDAPLRLVQAGSVPAETSLEPLLRGLDRVARAHPGQVELQVLASPERWSRTASVLGDPEWLQLAGLVSPAVAQREIAAASANVLLRPGDQHRQYVAAKLMDYLGARRPVLGIVSATGEMTSLARDYGDLRLVAAYTEESVAAAVEKLLEDHSRGLLLQPAQGHKPIEELTRGAQTSVLARALESVL